MSLKDMIFPSKAEETPKECSKNFYQTLAQIVLEHNIEIRTWGYGKGIMIEVRQMEMTEDCVKIYKKTRNVVSDAPERDAKAALVSVARELLKADLKT